MKKEYLECGRIVTTHGVRGEVKVEPWCDGPEFFLDLDKLYWDKAGGAPCRLEKARVQKQMALLKLEGIDSLDQAVLCRGKVLYVHREDVPMEEGQHFVQDLIGLRVVDADDGREYGVLTQVSETGANDVYHIRFADGKERLIPAIPQVVRKVDLDGEVMTIHPLEGLFDED